MSNISYSQINVNTPALQELLPSRQWVCFNQEKQPISPVTLKGVTGALIEGNTDWTSYDEAARVAESKNWLKGVGREFIKSQNLTGIDFDRCIDAQGNLAPFGQEWVTLFNSYTETSPSGHGLHIWVHGSIPKAITPEPFIDYVEAYDQKRFFTVTGKHYAETPTTIEERQDKLTRFYNAVLRNRKAKAAPCRELERKIKELEGRTTGGRNTELSRVAFRAGVLIAQHGLLQDRIEAAIWKACEKNGLASEEREQTERTLSSQIQAGMKQGPAQEMPHYHADPGAGSMSNGYSSHRTDMQPGSFNLTDLGNAERFAQQYRGRVLWCQMWNTWLIFNGRCWERDISEHVDQLAKETVRAIYAEAAAEPDDARRSLLAKHAVKSESRHAIYALLECAKSELPAQPKDFNKDIHLLNCKNGTLDLRTGELRPHEPKDMQTRCIDIAYNPLAECPRWRSFMLQIFAGDADLIAFMQRALGMSLDGDISEQCWFLCHGEGNNGKSTLLETVGAILSGYALAAKIESFQAKRGDRVNYDQAEFYGVRLITAAENQRGTRLDEGFMKKITGGEKIRAEHKYTREFEFMPECTIWLSVNHKPVIKDTSKGMWRRVRYIPFLVTVPDNQIDLKLREKLLQEAEGILAWLVQGNLDRCREGRLTIPEKVQAATQAYREEQDICSRFLSEECSFTKNAKLTIKALNTRFEEWCEQNGEKYDARALKAELNRRGYQSRKSGGARLYNGIEFKPDDEPPPPTPEPDDDDTPERDEDMGQKGQWDTEFPQVPIREIYIESSGNSVSQTSQLSQFDFEPGQEAKKSPFEVPKASIQQMRETIRAYGMAKDWPKLVLHPNFSIGSGELAWNEFLRKPGFYGLEWQYAYDLIMKWNAMYPPRGRK